MHRDIGLLDAILVNAVEIASQSEREAYLDQVCGGDADLRREVESLVADHFRAGSFLEGAAMLALTIDEPGPRIGEQIGRYKLLERIGEGGMGVVYVAEQTTPVRRKVALKIIKPGMDSRQVIARFEAERQALALMDHPNIARILDAGMTSDTIGVNGSVPHDSHHPTPHSEFRTPHLHAGLPYFVMELVRGLPITEYCDEARLHPRQRLELFITVCQAVQHAHQKGIIHRDLKPSNILVTLHDGDPVVKVIDFGVAKAIGQQLSEHTIYTAFSQLIGTPLYMSPEQAELSGLDIDTRSDVYSLGVLLYELLTGMTPFDRATFLQAGHDEMRRMIREDEPPRPSHRLSTLNAEAVSTLSAKRGLDHRQLSNLIRGELDWIAMKCLEKDRKRRYESASHLGSDIEHFLQGETVQACPPSMSYRLRKFSRRYRSALVTTTAMAILLVAGTVISAWQALEAVRGRSEAQQARRDMQVALVASEQARKDAESARMETAAALTASEHARKDAESARKQTTEALTESEAARKQSESVTNYLVTAFRSPDPQLDGSKITVAELLDAAVEASATELGDESPIRIHLLQAIAQTYQGLGLRDKALTVQETVCRLAKETDHPDFWVMQRILGQLHFGASDTLIPDDQDGYKLVGHKEKAIVLLEDAVAGLRSQYGSDHSRTRNGLSALATCYAATGRVEEAISMHEDNLRWAREAEGHSDRDKLFYVNALARACIVGGRSKEAVPLLEESLKENRTTFGFSHPRSLGTATSLANAYENVGRLDEAIALHEETLQLKRLHMGTDHSASFTSMNLLGLAYRRAGRLSDAVKIFSDEFELSTNKLGLHHATTQCTVINLIGCYLQSRMYDKALELSEQRLELAKVRMGPDHPEALVAVIQLANIYKNSGKADKAIELLHQTTAAVEEGFGAIHPYTLSFKAQLGQSYNQIGKSGQAAPFLEGAYQGYKELHGAHDSRTLSTLNLLAIAYMDAWRLNDGLRLFEPWLGEAADQICSDKLEELPVALRSGLYATYTRLLLKTNDFTRAEKIARQCLEMRQTSAPDSWAVYYTQALLGGALLGQQKYVDAETLMLEGYGGIKRLEQRISPYEKHKVTDSIQNLVDLYDAWDKPYEATWWRTVLEEQTAANQAAAAAPMSGAFAAPNQGNAEARR